MSRVLMASGGDTGVKFLSFLAQPGASCSRCRRGRHQFTVCVKTGRPAGGHSSAAAGSSSPLHHVGGGRPTYSSDVAAWRRGINSLRL